MPASRPGYACPRRPSELPSRQPTSGGCPMKITGLRTRRIHIPFDRPIGTAIPRIDGVSGLLVWLATAQGITGESYLWAIGRHRVPVLEAMVRLRGARSAAGRGGKGGVRTGKL